MPSDMNGESPRTRRRWIVIAAAIAAVPVVLVAAILLASESGEVVVLTTYDAAGEARTTRVWAVDYEGQVWLRSGSPQSGWFKDIEHRTDITVVRNGNTVRASARPDVGQRAAINELMRAKYGAADAFIAVVFGRDDAVPIRVVPHENDEATTH